jgi:hypothetical protein
MIRPMNHGRHESLELIGVDLEPIFPPDAMAGQHIGDGKGHDVHEPVVLQSEAADLQDDRVHMRRQMLPPEEKIPHSDSLSSIRHSIGKGDLTTARRPRVNTPVKVKSQFF